MISGVESLLSFRVQQKNQFIGWWGTIDASSKIKLNINKRANKELWVLFQSRACCFLIISCFFIVDCCVNSSCYLEEELQTFTFITSHSKLKLPFSEVSLGIDFPCTILKLSISDKKHRTFSSFDKLILSYMLRVWNSKKNGLMREELPMLTNAIKYFN